MDTNGVKVVDLDPDKPPCWDVQGNKLNMIRQAMLEFEIQGLKDRKRVHIVFVRDLQDMEILICINTLIPVLFPYPSDDTEDTLGPSHTQHKAAKVSTLGKEKYTKSIFNMGKSKEENYKILKEHLLELYGDARTG